MVILIVYRTLHHLFQSLQACTDDDNIDDIHRATSRDAQLTIEPTKNSRRRQRDSRRLSVLTTKQRRPNGGDQTAATKSHVPYVPHFVLRYILYFVQCYVLRIRCIFEFIVHKYGPIRHKSYYEYDRIAITIGEHFFLPTVYRIYGLIFALLVHVLTWLLLVILQLVCMITI